ncbi:MAG TPA: hypothetical protein VF364_01135 [Candidatus Limnocylindria bacterium]
MSNEDRSASRAEARRRARLAARGDYAEPETTEPEAPPRPDRGGFLSRMFPPAPPLPNRPDPLAGFSGSGPLRPIAESLFLLRRNPLAWILPGLVAFVGFLASFSYATDLLGMLGTFLLFGALIAAGWFGWQRPALFGVVAALVGFFIATAIVLFSFSQQGATPDTFGEPTEVIGQLALQGLYQSALGFLGGWYGGYLRRRQTQLSANQPPRRRRR